MRIEIYNQKASIIFEEDDMMRLFNPIVVDRIRDKIKECNNKHIEIGEIVVSKRSYFFGHPVRYIPS